MILFEKLDTPQKKAIQENSDIIIESCRNTGLFPSVTMAQTCLESLYFTKHIGRANNYFGFKGNGQPNEFWDGRVLVKDTIENYNGKDVNIKDKFRVYDSFEMSLKDRNRLLHTKRYEKVLTAKTPEEQAQFIKDAGYATDPLYPKKLIWIINKFGLKKMDV